MCSTKSINAFLLLAFGWMPARVALGILSFLGFINLYMVRINLSIIIVAMTGGRGGSSDSDPSSLSACHLSFNSTNIEHQEATKSYYYYNTTIPTQQQEEQQEEEQETLLDWSKTTQGVVLASFYYGYFITQVPGGRAAELYGTKKVFGVCILAGGVASFLAPIAAKLHFWVFIALRVLQGWLQGVSWPAMHVLTTRWIPPYERTRFISYVYLASTLSISITLPLCGVLLDRYGWEVTFYLTGLPSLLWCLAWFTLVHDFPTQHPRISEEELTYIVTKVEEGGTYLEQREGREQKSVPWRSMLTSLPLWALIAHTIGNGWGIAFFFTQLPTYMRNVLGFSIKSNGLLSAVPFISRYLGSIVWSNLADYTTSRKYISLRASRKMACVLALIVPGAAILWLSFSGCQWKLAVGLFCFALFCNGAVTISDMANHMDIAPNFAGTTLGLDNTVSSIISFVVPMVVGAMTDGRQTLEQWKKVFWTFVPTYIVPAVFYLIFSSTSVQPWNTLKGTITTTEGESCENEDGKKEQISKL